MSIVGYMMNIESVEVSSDMDEANMCTQHAYLNMRAHASL